MLITLRFFLVAYDISQSGTDLNDDLEKVNNWAFLWKKNFNPEINKQVQEIIFFLQTSEVKSLPFNVQRCQCYPI